MRLSTLQYLRSARRFATTATLVALLLVYGQVAGAVHAANLAAHLDARPCELCVALGGGHAVVPPPGLVVAIAAGEPTSTPVLVDVIPRRLPDPVYRGRAPPSPAI